MRDIGPLLENRRDQSKLPALAAAVVRDGRIAAAGISGVRKWGSDDPALLTDKFHIGSCTKSATALLAVLLKAKVPLDTTLEDALPDWEIPAEAKDITLRLLLQNRSGIGNTPPGELWAEAWSMSGSPTNQREKFLRKVLGEDLEAQPGTRYIYSNLGFALAGAVIEKRAGHPWEDLIREKIFEPLKLSSAGFGPPGETNQPQGHHVKEGEPVPLPPRDNPVAIAPGNAIHMSILDLARYTAFHLAVARGEVEALRADRDDLYTPPEGSDYALGWLVIERKWAGGKVLTHTGSNTMFFTVIWIAPAKNFAVVVATNIGDRDLSIIGKKCDDVVGALISEFVPE